MKGEFEQNEQETAFQKNKFEIKKVLTQMYFVFWERETHTQDQHSINILQQTSSWDCVEKTRANNHVVTSAVRNHYLTKPDREMK